MLQVSVIVITAAHSSVHASINVVMYLCVGFCSLVLYAPGVTNATLTLKIIKQ